MTRRIVTRADGRPAYEYAGPRLRQSHIDKWREIGRLAREPVELTDDPTGAVSFLADRQSSSRLGIAATAAGLGVLLAFFMMLP